MQYTDVFGFKKPEYAEEADVVDLNDNMDDIDDTLYKIRRLSGLVYDATTTSSNPYVEGNYTINPTDGLMYKCNGTTYGAWDSTKWTRTGAWDSTKWTRTDEFSEIELAMQSGGGSGSGYSETPLWSGTEESTSGGVTINLNGNISDYDAIVIDCGRNDGNDYRHGYLWYLISDISIGMWFLQIVNDNDNTTCYWRYTSDTSVTWQSAYSAYPVTLFSIKGLKFGGGGSSSGGTQYDTTEQVIGTWVDGRDVYRKLVPVNETWQNIGRDSYKAFAYQENWVKEIDYVTNAIAVSSEQYNANMFHVSVQVDRVNGIASAYWNMPFAGSYTSMYVDYVILEYVKVIPSTST